MLKAAHPVTNGKKQMGMSAINNPNINSMFVVCSLLFVVCCFWFGVSRFAFHVSRSLIRNTMTFFSLSFIREKDISF